MIQLFNHPSMILYLNIFIDKENILVDKLSKKDIDALEGVLCYGEFFDNSLVDRGAIKAY